MLKKEAVFKKYTGWKTIRIFRAIFTTGKKKVVSNGFNDHVVL